MKGDRSGQWSRRISKKHRLMGIMMINNMVKPMYGFRTIPA
ncbi:MAG: type II toxin-antitoxin system YoeB family toxin [Prevotellaceae bacterium]|nr:type II toxin-antitoxin system YoeB family toxin [Prevotellaceae bacterium]